MFSSALKSFTSNINSNYTVSGTPSSSSGPWRIYDAKKKSTGKAVSVRWILSTCARFTFRNMLANIATIDICT